MVVIGGGNTGLAAASRVARAGRKVVLVDKGPVGGLCSLAGCNPKKVFVRASEVLDEVRHASEHGIDTGPVTIDWERVWRRKRTFTDPVAGAAEQGLEKAGVERVLGTARFLGRHAIEANGEELRAEAFVVATGSTPRRLTFPGADLAKTTDDVLEIRKPPERMVILGGGVVAFEFSHVFARVGTKVTIVMRSRRPLGGFDDDFAALVVDYTRSLGVEFLEEASASGIAEANGALRVTIDTAGGAEARECDFVLNAAGRVPAIDELDLGEAGVETWRRGVKVDEFLRSANRSVFAGGDAHGILQLSPVASYDGRIIARNFLEGDVAAADYRTVPQAVYTTPPLATVGLTEAEARANDYDVDVVSHDMKSWKVFAIFGSPVARAKIVIERSTRRIAGAQLFGPGASETIHLFAMAMRCGATADDLREMIYAYPTFASAVQSVV